VDEYDHQLGQLEVMIRENPGDLDLQCQRADRLVAAGRREEAREAYWAILQQNPAHQAALVNFGVLLVDLGYPAAAKACFAEAVRLYPEHPSGYVNLAHLLREGGEMAEAHRLYQEALARDPDNAEAHQGLIAWYQERGRPDLAADHVEPAFGRRPVISLPTRGTAPTVSVLVLSSAYGGNIPLTRWLDDGRFQLNVACVETAKPQDLPPHQVVFNAVGDADVHPEALIRVKRLCSATVAPLINRPERVWGRQAVADFLRAIPGLITPRVRQLSRERLTTGAVEEVLAQEGFHFPVVVRAPGYHGGRHLFRADHARDLLWGIQRLPGRDVLLMEYLDTRGADGVFRKYRLMAINGRLYPVHLAVSSHWNVHYFSSETPKVPSYQAEEDRFFARPEEVLGSTALLALERAVTAWGLEVVGFDVAVTPQGLVVFEANPTMVLNIPRASETWAAYRRAPLATVMRAMDELIHSMASVAPEKH